MFTIEDLKQGKCAVINDSTLEELYKVLRSAFPNDGAYTRGEYKFYSMNFDSSNEWYPDDVTSLPTQSVKDFLIKEILN